MLDMVQAIKSTGKNTSGNSQKAEWKKYADAAEACSKTAKECGKISYAVQSVASSIYLDNPELGEKLVNISSSYSRLAETYGDMASAYKKNAENASDVVEFKNQTEVTITTVLNENARTVKTNNTANIISVGGFAYSSVTFYNNVKNGGDWDYKRPNVRRDDPRLAGIADMDYVYYDSHVMTWEEFGNYHYGYVGAPFGLGMLSVGSLWAAGGVVDYNELYDQTWIEMGFNANK